MTLAGMGVDCELAPVDIFARAGLPDYSMSPKSGPRFWGQDMRKIKDLKHVA